MPVVGQASVRIVADARGFARDVEQAVNRELRNVDPSPGARSMAQKTETTLKKETDRGFREVARTGLQAFGTTLQGGISPATAGTFGLVVLAALVPVMSIVGAAAAGALILGFGGGIAAIGVIAAAQSQRVQDAFGDMADTVTRTLRGLAKPIESALIPIAGILEDTFLAFAPALGDAFQALAPALVAFTEEFSRALIALEPAFGPIVDAFITLLEELGPALATEVFPDLSDAIINLAAAVSENADTITDILTWFLSAAEATINFLAELTRLAGWFANQAPLIQATIVTLGGVIVGILASFLGPVAAVVAAIIGLGVLIAVFWEDIREFFGLIGEFVIDILSGLADFLQRWGEELVEGFREWWDSAKETTLNALRAIRDFFVDTFNAVRSLVRGRIDQIKNTWNDLVSGARQVGRDIEGAWNTVIGFFARLPGRIAGAVSGMWDGIWETFRGTVNDIIGAWNGLSFTIPSATVFGQTIGGGTISTPNIPFLQEGGIIRQGGSVVVGEAGPELLTVPQGARVDPLPGGGEGAPIDVRVFIGDQELTDIVDVQINERNSQLRRRVTTGAGRTRTGILAA